MYLLFLGFILLTIAACGKESDDSNASDTAKAEGEEEGSYIEASINNAYYTIEKHVEETDDPDKNLLIIELLIRNTYDEEVRIANSQDVRLLDGDEEIEPILGVHHDLASEREIEIGVDKEKEHVVAFPVEDNKTYEISFYPKVELDAENPVLIPLDTGKYTDSLKEVHEPARALTAYVEEVYFDIENPEFDELVGENKDKLQHEAEETFYKALDRSSIHGFPKENVPEVYALFKTLLAEEGNIEPTIQENQAGEAVIDFSYKTLSLEKMRELISAYESEYHDKHSGFDPVEANKYAVSKIEGIIKQLETISGSYKIQMIEKDGKWILDPADYKSSGLVDIFVEGTEYDI